MKHAESAKRLNNLPDNFMKKESFTSMVKKRDKKRAAAKRKKAVPPKRTTVIGDLHIPLHAVKAIHTYLDSRPAIPFHPDNPPELNDVRKVTGNELVIVVDVTKLQESIMFTEYFRTRQQPRKRK